MKSGWFAGAAVMVLLGCKTTGVDRAENTVSNMRDVKTEVLSSNQKIDAVVGTLGTLAQGKGDMKQQYEAFGAAVADLKAHETQLKELRAKLQVKKEEYLQGWNEQMKQISSEDLRQRAEERRKKAEKTFEELSTAADSIRSKYDPWSSRVTDIHTYLENDLNAGGVASVAKSVETVKKDAEPIKSEIASLAKRLDEIISNIEAGRAETQKTTG